MKKCWFTWRDAGDGSEQECASEWGHQERFHENEDKSSISTDPQPPWGPWGKGWPEHDVDL